MSALLSTRDRFQYLGFRAELKVNLSYGDNLLIAFAKAIVTTRDDIVDKMLEENPNLIKEWKNTRNR